MRLEKVYARFYKSFNFDHVLKAVPNAQPRGEWELIGGEWYPYVEVPLDQTITAVVGANESGKSHLLTALEKAVSGRGLGPRDMCRYSDFFSVARGQKAWPHVGVGWAHVTDEEAQAIGQAVGGPTAFDRFLMFRTAPDALTFWLPSEGGAMRSFSADPATGQRLVDEVFPSTFRIDPSVALPGSVPLAWLANPDEFSGASVSRRERTTLLDVARGARNYLTDDVSVFTSHAPTLHSLFLPLARLGQADETEARRAKQLQLVKELLFGLAEIDPEAFKELAEAIAEGQEGYANALSERLNAQIEKRLNFRRWWVQDRDFSLRISAREHEVVFTIRDRTGTEYTFDERSSGLKYFLSYLIQSQANRSLSGRQQILLMDEPDAHLSAEAQQDLLRVFADLADAPGGEPSVQVVYVTHSPFLLDKNYADRIRVLEKGRNLDGTRVIRNVSQNHYEPLRSAFGAYVGETAFVGGVNLLVEGQADQILLAGAARASRPGGGLSEADTLDLNRLVIVPCGSASQVPYMTYLIRGRDADKPSVIALLDSDEEGSAAAALMRQDGKFKRLIAPKFVLQTGEIELGGGVKAQELEDFIPEPLGLAAANAVLVEAHQYRSGETPVIVGLDAAQDVALFDRLDAATRSRGHRLDKIAFARAVVQIATDTSQAADLRPHVEAWLGRMRTLFQRINALRIEAEERAARNKISSLVEARVRIFLADRARAATREQVAHLFAAVESQLDNSNEADAIRTRMYTLRRTYALDDDPTALVAPHDELVRDLTGLKDALASDRISASARLPPPPSSAPLATQRQPRKRAEDAEATVSPAAEKRDDA